MSRYEKIKNLCKERGITITGLERELGFAKGSISKIDKNQPSYDRLEKLANYFGLPIEFFSEVQNFAHPKEYYDPETLEMAQALYDDPELRALMKAAMSVNKDSISSLTDLLHTMKETNPDG